MSANLDYPHVDYRARFFRQMDYGIALQRAIEHHCREREIPADVAKGCPHHARLLNKHRDDIKRLEALLREARKGLPDGYKGQLSWRIDQELSKGDAE